MSKISRREFLRLSTAASAAAVLAACGGAATTEAPVVPTEKPAEVKPTEKPAEVKPTEKPAEVKPADTPVPEPTKGPVRPTTFPLGDVPRNRTFIRADGDGTPELCSPIAAGFNHQDGWALIWEPCAFYNSQGDKTYLWLAESYEYNADATVCTVHFRKGIEWSDGTPFTANDAAWTMTKLATVPGLNRASVYTTELVTAEAVDDLTLKVTLKGPDWRYFFKSLTWRYDLGDEGAIVPQHIYKDIADEELKAFKFWDLAKQWPVTTAAYGVSSTDAQANILDLRPSWWAVKTGFVAAEPDIWRFIGIPYSTDTLAAEQIINNETDVCLDIRPLIMGSLLAQTDHVTTWTGHKPPFGYTDWWPISVQFCTQKPPFDNPDVRHAVSHALDRQQLVDVAMGGAGKATLYPFPEFAHLMTYIDSIKDIIDASGVGVKDQAKVEELMGKAGFTKDKEGFFADKDGVRPDSDLYAAVPLFSDIAPVIAEQLRNAGFPTEHKSPQDVWAAKVDGRASMFLFGHGGAVIDPYDTFMLYRKENVAKMGEQSWGNITRWYNDEFTAITDEMNATPMDDPKMMDLFHRGMQIWYDALPDCPVIQWFHRVPCNLTYWTNWPTAENPYMNTAPWHLTELIVVLGLKATNA